MPIEKEKLLVIGNGMAALRLLELLSKDDCPYQITVFGSEQHAGYNRILLSPLLSGEQTIDDVITHDKKWYSEHAIDFKYGTTIVDIDRDSKKVTDAEGIEYPYDKMIIATGSNPFVPPIPGHTLKGIHTYRTIDDVNEMLAISETKKQAVVLGGGLLGLEVAYGLNKQGMDVTVLHLGSVLMDQQLDGYASEQLIQSLQKKGISIITGANTECFQGNEQVESVKLKDGTEIDADLVVMAVGIRPNISLAESVGLDCERGILVNDQLQTSDPSILALGECVQHRDRTYGLVAPLYEQAEICNAFLRGDNTATYRGSVIATGLKVTGVHLFSAGQFLEDDECKVIKLLDNNLGIYRKLVFKNNTLIGALLYGDISGSLWYQELIQSQKDITHYKDFIMFGPGFLPEQGADDIANAA